MPVATATRFSATRERTPDDLPQPDLADCGFGDEPNPRVHRDNRLDRDDTGRLDDPQRATREPATLVDQAVRSLTTALDAQKQSLDGWQQAQGDDTEVLRVACAVTAISSSCRVRPRHTPIVPVHSRG